MTAVWLCLGAYLLGSIPFGMVVARLKQLRDEAHLAGVSAEINPGSLLSHEQVMESLRLYIQEVMPHFK